MKEICGGKIERDTESPSLNTNEGKNAKPKHRKWKMQARQDDKSGEKGAELQKGPNIAKRPASEKHKRRRLDTNPANSHEWHQLECSGSGEQPDIPRSSKTAPNA
ncbi:hypothetical protein WN943_029786 [Citrus x changshan-huyou]